MMPAAPERVGQQVTSADWDWARRGELADLPRACRTRLGRPAVPGTAALPSATGHLRRLRVPPVPAVIMRRSGVRATGQPRR